ncbi:type II toxin-antitoxin system RelE/ParE family toxin [Rhizobium leguminosarum]|jgi:plasmid stabilization system protein ParE|uniref:Type II toxin-antitoxin system RelE/ParE family toxin n=1 Tax=Rhizobium leguminosarum TaxID=384 RepID=A0A7K3VIP1_RHILE|nr:type II toxin-antitoxin system RelE/ParE family toxin [Rhizobium leguminosarum]MBY2934343.1 type II toxin-antitoxin system RelE/ParE family toxin [Rhizobium leguminosarum]MBY5327039.1 type II toxin-antitoxin system RelE/ParE family toxin [Rhizobium leguminosarum]NEH56612.1 type II toxin-antitoxin system RelE/ParE family toxin [Rhizobium leguminosarum]NEK17033.1 type II toxin-antitoxin system RelE/ParE family toxin [Rhizobium leguminosarum]NEK33612.1 type II toxin-antitoxin system RelE/ParE 
MKYTVRLSVAAQHDVEALLDYLVPVAGEAVAQGYVDRLRSFLEGFQSFPKRGTVRDEIRAGLRIVGFERSLSIAFTVEAETVYILRIMSGGQELKLYEE